MKHIKLFEQFVNEALVFNDGQIDIWAAIESIKSGLEDINPGFYSISKGALGTDTIMVLVSFEPREEWSNGYVENSNYFRMSIQQDGKMEVFTQSLYEPNQAQSYNTRLKIKFRKATAKSIADVSKRLGVFVVEVQKALGKI